jgi:hypothetical protein
VSIYKERIAVSQGVGVRGRRKKEGVEWLELTDRDFLILGLVYRFRFCQGRHIKALAGFSGTRAADRRLRSLVDADYLSRKKYLYGVSYLYTLTHKGRILLGVNKRADKIRVDKITHDIFVLDAVIYYMSKYNLSLEKIESEKELHIKDGFGTRKHHPDFVFEVEGEKQAVEVELSPKTKERLEKNVRDNYLNFDKQIWITNDSKVITLLDNFADAYSNIEVVRLEEILKNVRE